MLQPIKKRLLLKPTSQPYEKRAVFNPAVIEVDGALHMFYRAVNSRYVSSIGYCRFEGGKLVHRSRKPIIAPEYRYEQAGVEDPRIVAFEGRYYLFYTVFDGRNARMAYAVSDDLKKFEKQGPITPGFTYDEAEDLFRDQKLKERYTFFELYFKQMHGKRVLLWEKDGFILPRRIRGKIGLVHRVLPGIQIAYCNDLSELTDDYWREYLDNQLSKNIILDPNYWFESRNIGGGAPLLETKDGWLFIYHGVEDSHRGRVYHAGAALLSKNNPTRVLGRLSDPLFSPKTKWERYGEVNSVVFPSSVLREGKNIKIYYGAADTVVGEITFLERELIAALKQNNKHVK